MPKRRIFFRQRTTQGDLTKVFGARAQDKKPLTDLQAFGAVMSFFVGLAAAGFAALALLAWLAWENRAFAPFFLAAVKENVGSYDPNLDALGYYRLKAIIANGFPGLKQATPYDPKLGPDEVLRIVRDTIDQFKRHVEVGNLWEELWVGTKPKKERAAQLIYYAMADMFCKANDLDISPEANMGGGPIDFKFSSGYQARVLVEMKRSSGTVVHGYEKQLEFYKAASQTEFAMFVIIDYGDLGNKLNDVKRIRDQRIERGQRASEIVVIDATRKASASKRK